MKTIDIIILSSVLLVVACSSKKGLNRALNKAKKELDKEEKCNCKKNI